MKQTYYYISGGRHVGGLVKEMTEREAAEKNAALEASLIPGRWIEAETAVALIAAGEIAPHAPRPSAPPAPPVRRNRTSPRSRPRDAARAPAVASAPHTGFQPSPAPPLVYFDETTPFTPDDADKLEEIVKNLKNKPAPVRGRTPVRADFRPSKPPSKYQQAIFDAVRDGDYDIIVNAVAGSGKSHVLTEIARLIDCPGIFVAFNKHIAESLNQKLSGTNMRAVTVHSMGLRTLAPALRGKPEIVDGKYRRIIKDWFSYPANRARFKEMPHAQQHIRKLVDFARLTLTDDAGNDALEALADRYNLEFIPEYGEPVRKAIQEGEREARELSRIDFTDMINLPHRWNLTPDQYLFVACDEAQDLNAAQLDLVLKMREPGGRIIFVGDERQAIMMFSGADARSYNAIRQRTGAREMPLSICYRCPESHLKLAQEIVPYIEARPEAPAGILRHASEDDMQREVREGDRQTGRRGDLIICRRNAPLLKHCLRMMSSRRPARVRGRDVGKELASLVRDIGDAARDFRKFLTALGEYEARSEERLAAQDASEQMIETLHDKCEAVRVCYEGFAALDAEELASQIEGIFSDYKDDNCIWLSSIHRCVHPDTIVETPGGLSRIRDIGEQGIIGTPAGMKEYIAKFRIPRGRVLKVVTRSGYSITVTPDHGLSSWVDGEWRRVKAGSLYRGSWLRLSLVPATVSEPLAPLPAPPAVDRRAADYKFPSVLGEELAEFIGLVVADGSVYRMGVRLLKRDQDVVERFKELARTIFGVESHDVPFGRHGNCYGAEVNSIQIASWLRLIGGMSPNEKYVPPAVLASPLHVQAAFLSGIFEDGSVNVREGKLDHVHLDNRDPRVTETIQTMLLRFGIISSATSRASQKYMGTLYIFGANAEKFSELIGFVSSPKNTQIAKSYAGIERMYSVPLNRQQAAELRPYLSESSYNNAYYRGYLSRHTVREALGKMPTFSPLMDLLDWHYERVTFITESESETMCVEVPDGSRFLQNGFDGWNSKGLENHRIFILEYDRLGLGNPRQSSEELMQEQNLRYVALTRATEELVLVGEGGAKTDNAVATTADALSFTVINAEGGRPS